MTTNVRQRSPWWVQLVPLPGFVLGGVGGYVFTLKCHGNMVTEFAWVSIISVAMLGLFAGTIVQIVLETALNRHRERMDVDGAGRA